MNRTRLIVLGLAVVVSTVVIGGFAFLTESSPSNPATLGLSEQDEAALESLGARPPDQEGLNREPNPGVADERSDAEGAVAELSLPSENVSLGEMLGAQGASGGLLQGEDEGRILPVDEAFPFDHLYDRDQLILRWQTVEGHYLYRHRFALHGASGETISLQLPEGKLEKDPYFGDVYIFENPLEVSIDMNQLMVNGEAGARFRVTYQGCAKIGYCYPPQQRLIEINGSGA